MLRLAVMILMAGVQVHASYIDCSSTGTQLAFAACTKPLNQGDASNNATACAYYTKLSACISTSCCGGTATYFQIAGYKQAVTMLGVTGCTTITCTAATDASAPLDCDGRAVSDIVYNCRGKLNSMDGVDPSKACAYWTGVQACIPMACCGSASYKSSSTSVQQSLANVGVAANSCPAVCGAKLSMAPSAPIVTTNAMMSMALGVLYATILFTRDSLPLDPPPFSSSENSMPCVSAL